MRVVRKAGENISPSDDGNLYDQIFVDGLFYDTTISSLGSNQVSIGNLYGIIQGREFTNDAETIEVVLPATDTATGYIYVEYNFASETVGSIGSALEPFTPTVEDINSTGTVVQMVIARYTASAVAVTDITPTYELAQLQGSGLTYNITLLSSTWSNNQYTLVSQHITPSKIILMTYPSTLTDAQYEALADADIRPYGAIADGSMVLKALGTQPTIDIPIQLIIADGQIGG